MHNSMIQNSLSPESLVFILGSQRSGTTWLANIFDASPAALIFMEPFAPAYGIFPEFPEASYFLENSSPFLHHLLLVEMPNRLLRYKSLLFWQSITHPAWFRLERWLTRAVSRKGRFVPNRLQNRFRKFELLNLNRMDAHYPLYPKNSQTHIWVIKELRFAGKIPILRHAFPRANFIVIMRHPYATVHSILNLFERGSLGELRRDLETYLEKIEVQTTSKLYKNLINFCRNGNLVHKIALYWRISYETMYKQLEKHTLVQFLVYEELALQPKKTVERIFQQVGIPWSASLDDYLSYSTKKKLEKPSAITTVRESKTFCHLWLEEISEEVKQAVSDITGDSFLMPYFGPYYTSRHRLKTDLVK